MIWDSGILLLLICDLRGGGGGEEEEFLFSFEKVKREIIVPN
jgi:hypothetical protein